MSLLEVQGLTKKFGGLTAVDNLNLQVGEGEIVGLIGPNGAGKTTAFNVISGVMPETSGSVAFRGKDMTRLSADQVAAAGLVRTWQETAIFDDFSVLDNVLVGLYAGSLRQSRTVFTVRRKPSDGEPLREKAVEALRFMGLDDLQSHLAGALPHGHRKALGIAMALSTGPKLLLLDEPATGLNDTEKSVMMDHIQRIHGNGIAVLLVEHSMRLVMSVCHRLIVLNFGRKIAEGVPSAIRENPTVIEAYLGVDEEDAGHKQS